MSWEEEDLDAFTIKPVTPSALIGRWDDEDVERPGQIKDNWEDEDEENEDKPKAETQKNFAKTSKKKQSGKQKLKKDEQKAAEEEATRPANPLTYEEKKALQDRVEKADFAHAVDLFDGVQDADNESLFGEGGASKRKQEESSTTALPADDETFQPTTPADFKKFGTMLAQKITPYKENFSYHECVKQFLKDATASSDPEEVKELIATLNVIVNERIKAQQTPKKKKAAAKKASAKGKEVVHMDDEFSAF